MGQNAGRRAPTFSVFLTASKRGRAVWRRRYIPRKLRQAGTTQNSSQKCRHPTSQRNGNRSQGGWGIVPPASHIDVPYKCSAYCITNPLGDAVCGAIYVDSRIDPRRQYLRIRTCGWRLKCVIDAIRDGLIPSHSVLPLPPLHS